MTFIAGRSARLPSLIHVMLPKCEDEDSTVVNPNSPERKVAGGTLSY